jgi:hypothetical protein
MARYKNKELVQISVIPSVKVCASDEAAPDLMPFSKKKVIRRQ